MLDQASQTMIDTSSNTRAAVRVSVVIPAKDEADNLRDLIPEIQQALDGERYEIIVVDDGSDDDTAELVAAMNRADARIRTIRHSRSCGQSAALWSGVQTAKGELIATLDGDGQNDPQYLPGLLDALDNPEIGLATGQRVGRRASFSKRMGSRIANAVRGWMLNDNTRDTGCGLKAFRRIAFCDLPYFSSLHRFLPALFKGDGWQVAHRDVVDRPRMHGRSKYGIFDRLAVGVPDMFGVRWLINRRKRHPLRLAGQLEDGERGA